MEGVPASLGGRRYRLQQPLGQGAIARVFRAHDSFLDVDRAVKVLPPAFAAFPERLKRFRREARALAKIRHSNVVIVYDGGVELGHAYLVMELLDSGTLRSRVEQHGPLAPRLAVHVMLQVLAGLKAAHGQQILHRNIRPENVFLDPPDTVKLADFGLARMHDHQRLTFNGEALGAWPYAAPEQLDDATVSDERSDIYSIAATLYFVVTGREPSHIEKAGEHERVFRMLPQALAEVIAKAAAQDPAHRYASAAELAAALQRVDLPPDPADAVPLAP